MCIYMPHSGGIFEAIERVKEFETKEKMLEYMQEPKGEAE